MQRPWERVTGSIGWLRIGITSTTLQQRGCRFPSSPTEIRIPVKALIHGYDGRFEWRPIHAHVGRRHFHLGKVGFGAIRNSSRSYCRYDQRENDLIALAASQIPSPPAAAENGFTPA